MRSMIAVACVITATCAANADAVSTTCNRSGHSVTCDTSWVHVPERAARVINIKHPVRDEEAYRRWWAYCDPVVVNDDLGVGHYIYAHKGCEYGRDH